MPYRDPISQQVYYTKQEIDAMIGGVASIASATGVKMKLVPSWTAGTFAGESRVYYDLSHGKGRPVFVVAYDAFAGAEYPLDKETINGDFTYTRIWLIQDPGASRILLAYF